jgi:hypothetical protein
MHYIFQLLKILLRAIAPVAGWVRASKIADPQATDRAIVLLAPGIVDRKVTHTITTVWAATASSLAFSMNRWPPSDALIKHLFTALRRGRTHTTADQLGKAEVAILEHFGLETVGVKISFHLVGSWFKRFAFISISLYYEHD